VILFLDIEHPSALEDAAYRSERVVTMEQRRRRFESLSGEPCIIRHYSDFRASELASREISALVTSGNRALWENYHIEADFREFKQAIGQTDKPVLGICGGHQLIGLLLGATAEPLRRLHPEESDIHPDYAPGNLKEWGYYEVEVGTEDPLFAGFDGRLLVKQAHFWHLTSLPQYLISIARNDNCPVQAMRHRDQPIYGVQFHPEFYDDEHIDGRLLLENFFSLARLR